MVWYPANRPKYFSRNRGFRSKSFDTFGNCAMWPKMVHSIYLSSQRPCIWLCCADIISHCHRYYPNVWSQATTSMNQRNRLRGIYFIWMTTKNHPSRQTCKICHLTIIWSRLNRIVYLMVVTIILYRRRLRLTKVATRAAPARIHRPMIWRCRQRNRTKLATQRNGPIRAAKNGQNSPNRPHRMYRVRDQNQLISICNERHRPSSVIRIFYIQNRYESHRSPVIIAMRIWPCGHINEKVKIRCRMVVSSRYEIQVHRVLSNMWLVRRIVIHYKMICDQYNGHKRKRCWTALEPFHRRRSANHWSQAKM